MNEDFTVEAIRDFQVCELFYESRYLKQLYEPQHARSLLATKFAETAKKVANFFFYRVQSGEVPEREELFQKWEKLWFPEDMSPYDLVTQQHPIGGDTLISLSNLAMSSLDNFYGFFSLMGGLPEGTPVAIDDSFRVPITRSHYLTGTLDLVLLDNNRYKVIKWVGSRSNPRPMDLFYDLAALKYGFGASRNPEHLPVDYMVFNLGSSTDGYLDVDPPQSADVDALLYWARKAIASDHFVPRRGYTAYCKGCPFDKTCLEWQNWSEAKHSDI